MKKIGLIDVDGHNFPNLPLMKIAAYHKSLGDRVEWYEPFKAYTEGKYDIVYLSKVFSFTPDYEYPIVADQIIKGGSGYCIEVVEGKEIYRKEKDKELPYEIEHIYPAYEIYFKDDYIIDETTGKKTDKLTKAEKEKRNTAYGFLSRGCPRGCNFCHVKVKEGQKSRKVADLSEFWKGQKNIAICDPNILACKEWKELLQQLIDSEAWVDFNQGLDIRLMTKEKAEMIGKIKTKTLHFAWDRYEDKEKILPKFKEFKKVTSIDRKKLIVYVLCGYDTTFEQDLERVYTLRDIGYMPYIMLYNKESIPKGAPLRKLQRWVNCRWVFETVKKFEDYEAGKRNEREVQEKWK